MRCSFVLALIAALSLPACGDDASPPQDSAVGGDALQSPDSGAPDGPAGSSCSEVQTCAATCNEPGYAECIAACRAPASEKAQALLAAYDACAAEVVEGACQQECAAGPGDARCGQCVMSKCITQWNDCRLDE